MIKRYIRTTYVALTLLLVSLTSCNPVFPDYELDNFWKLKQIEYKNGVDYAGNACDVKQTESIFFGFAGSTVQIQNLEDKIQDRVNGFSMYGKMRYTEDSLRIDYSVYTAEDTNLPLLLNSLQQCGVGDFVVTYSVDKLDNKELILSDDNVILNFIKW